MTTDSNELASLESRIAAAEDSARHVRRENRILKGALAATAAAFSAAVMLGAALAARQGANLGKVTATQLTIVDESGREMLQLGQNEKGYGMQVLGKDGNKEIAMGVAHDGASAGLAIFDALGHARIGLGMTGSVPSLAVTDDNGKKVVALGAGASRQGVGMFDANEVLRAALAMGPDGPLLCLNDASGKVCAAIGRRDDGTYGLSTLNEDFPMKRAN